MTGFTASERALANAIWAEIKDPRKIHSKGEIQSALAANGIIRSQNTLFNNLGVRRLLEGKAEDKGRALVIIWGCVFIANEEWLILNRQVRALRTAVTHCVSVGHPGRGNYQLMTAVDPMSRDIGDLCDEVGRQGRTWERVLLSKEEALKDLFDAGRTAGKAHFATCRARTL